MREILFRGKPLGRIDKKGFVYGSLGVIDTDLVAIYQCKEFTEDIKCLVDIGTVGQYTGLTDKNGTKIFEGDIVEGLDYTAEDGGYGVVTFDDGAFEVVGSCDNNIVGTFYENYFGKDFEIIGNIHDNPELLKGESNERK